MFVPTICKKYTLRHWEGSTGKAMGDHGDSGILCSLPVHKRGLRHVVRSLAGTQSRWRTSQMSYPKKYTQILSHGYYSSTTFRCMRQRYDACSDATMHVAALLNLQ